MHTAPTPPRASGAREATGFAWTILSLARICRAFGLLLAVGGAAGIALAAPELTFEPVSQISAWKVSRDGRPVMIYSFNPAQYKPYVKELYAWNGVNILRDAPSDHLHHHALMYAVRVNGLNFWEETPGNGVQRVVKTQPPVARHNAAGQPEAVLTQTIHWVAPADAFLPDTTRAALLIEERTLTVALDESRREVALRWQSEFTAGTNPVTLGGSSYFGLGMRFRKDFDLLADHHNAGGKPDLSGSKQDVSRHPWGSVAFAGSDLPAQVVLYGHPGNARGDAYFFTMKQAFPYLAATQGLDKEPLAYPAGGKFALKYLVTVYPEIKTPEAITARGKEWGEAP